MKTWKKLLLPLFILIVGSISVSAIVISKPKPAPNTDDKPPANIQVKAIQAQIKTVQLSVLSQGTVQPKREIDLVSQVNGVIVSADAHFVNGRFFEHSHRLLKIDDRDYHVALLNAQARYASAQSRLAEEEGLATQAKREWRNLGSDNANSLFLRKPQLAAAKASVAFAKADEEKAKLDLERTQISAPFSGRIRETLVNEGQFVNAGTRLARVYDTSTVEIRLPLTDSQASKINLQVMPQKNDTDVEPQTVLINGVVAGQPFQWPGTLTRSDAFVDINTRMYYVVAEVKNPFKYSTPLLPGLFVNAEIKSGTSIDVIVVPEQAIFKRDQIYIIDDANKVQQKQVAVLKKAAGEAWLQNNFDSLPIVALEKQTLVLPDTEIEPLL